MIAPAGNLHDERPASKRAPWLLIILVLAAGLRLWGLDRVPPPLNADEASRGYDAWALLETGADRHGEPWPYFLRSYGPGDWSAALSTYLTMPFIALLGPTPTAMRLPNAVLSTCSVLLLYALVRRRMGEPAALAAALILALDPWHIGLTRTAHESGTAPVFLLLALLGLDRAGLLSREPAADAEPRDQRDRLLAAVIAGLALAMHTWVYPATRFFTPLFLAAVVLIYRRDMRTRWRSASGRGVLLAAVAGLLIGAWPLLSTAIRHPERLAARADVALLADEGGRHQWARNVAVNYGLNISPRDWYWHSDDMTGVALPGIGRHLIVTAPAFALGLIVLLARLRRDRWAQLLLAWLVLYPLPAAICRDWNPHPMRTVTGMPLYPIICAVGVTALGAARGWLTAGAAALLINGAVIAERYVRFITTDGAVSYQAALIEAVRFAARQPQGAEFVLVTNRCVQPNIYVLLEQPIAPGELSRLDWVTVPGRLRFDEVLKLGRFYFAPKDPADAGEATRKFREVWSAIPPQAVGLLVVRCQEGGVGELIGTFEAGEEGRFRDCYSVWRATRADISP